MSSENTDNLPIKSLKIAIAGLTSDEDGARAAGVLREVPFVNTAVVLRDRGYAVVTVPTGFQAYDSLEKVLGEKGFRAVMLDPLHVTLKATRSDGAGSLPDLANGFLTVSGVVASAPEGAADAVAIYADPAKIDLAQLVSSATEKGYQAAVQSHEILTVKVEGMTCKRQEPFVVSALTGIAGVVRANADFASASAAVLVEKGKTSVEAIAKALTEANPGGNWCPMGHDECDEAKEKAASEHPRKAEHPGKSEHPSGGGN